MPSIPPPLRPLVLALALAAGVGADAAGCSSGPSREECKQLMEHVVDLYAPHQTGDALTSQQRADLAAQKAEVTKQIAPKFMDECEKTLPRKQVECALKARTEADLAACEQG